MNPVWQIYLRNRYAVIENNCVMHFGDITAERKDTGTQTRTIMADLSHYGLIRFSGDDAKTFCKASSVAISGKLICNGRNTVVIARPKAGFWQAFYCGNKMMII